MLRTFAEISGLNIVIDPTIQGTVDVALRDVPWDQALDIILRANKLGYVVDGTIVRVAPLDGAGRRGSAAPQAGRGAGARRRAARADAVAQLRAGRGAARRCSRATVLSQRGIDPDRRAHQHAHHHATCPSGSTRAADAARRRSTGRSRRSRSKRASSRRRATSRARSACSGASAAARRRRSATRCRWRSRIRRRSAAAPARAQGPAADAARPVVNLGVDGRDAAPSAWRSARSTARQPRRRAVGARATGPGTHPLDAARLDAEQRRGRDHAGHPDSDSDRRQQHRDGDVQGRGADAAVTPQITAANTVIMRSSSRTRRPTSAARSTAFRRSTRSARITQVLVERRRDDGHRRHLRQPRAGERRTGRRAAPAAAARLAVQARRASPTRAASC